MSTIISTKPNPSVLCTLSMWCFRTIWLLRKLFGWLFPRTDDNDTNYLDDDLDCDHLDDAGDDDQDDPGDKRLSSRCTEAPRLHSVWWMVKAASLYSGLLTEAAYQANAMLCLPMLPHYVMLLLCLTLPYYAVLCKICYCSIDGWSTTRHLPACQADFMI